VVDSEHGCMSKCLEAGLQQVTELPHRGGFGPSGFAMRPILSGEGETRYLIPGYGCCEHCDGLWSWSCRPIGPLLDGWGRRGTGPGCHSG